MNESLEEKVARLRDATATLQPAPDFGMRLESALMARSPFAAVVGFGRRAVIGAFAVAAIAFGVSEMANDSALGDLEGALYSEFDVEAPW